MLYGEDIQNDFNFSHRVFMKGLFISYNIYLFYLSHIAFIQTY